MQTTNPSFKIFGVNINPVNKYQALDFIVEMFNKKSSSLICTVNVEFIMLAQKSAQFNTALNRKSALNIIDGAGIIWGSKILNSWRPATLGFKQVYVTLQLILGVIFYPWLVYLWTKRIPRITGSDFVWDICKWASDNRKTVFILGNKNGLDPNAVQKASLELQTKIYDLKVVGTHAGTASGSEEKGIVELIKKSGADILFCSFGSPAQEIWLAKNLGHTGCKIGIGLGATFDFIAGVQRRAPGFISKIGLEWLFRLISRPKRIKRQRSLVEFTGLILKARLR